HFLSLGNLEEAGACGSKQLEAAEAMGDEREIAVSLVGLGRVFLCQGGWNQAAAAFQKARQVSRQDEQLRAWAAYASGRAALAQGKRSEAREQLLEALVLARPDPLYLVD